MGTHLPLGIKASRVSTLTGRRSPPAWHQARYMEPAHRPLRTAALRAEFRTARAGSAPRRQHLLLGLLRQRQRLVRVSRRLERLYAPSRRPSPKPRGWQGPDQGYHGAFGPGTAFLQQCSSQRLGRIALGLSAGYNEWTRTRSRIDSDR